MAEFIENNLKVKAEIKKENIISQRKQKYSDSGDK